MGILYVVGIPESMLTNNSYFLQTQYVFIHNALDELVTCGDTEIAAVNMRIFLGKLSRTVERRRIISGFQKQFEVSE